MKDVEKIDIQPAPEGAVIAVKAVPGASRDKIVGVLGDALKVAVSAAPEKGKANSAIAAALAKALNVPARAVSLVQGLTNPRKHFLVAGLNVPAVRDRLAVWK